MNVLCEAVKILSTTMEDCDETVPQSFRDAFSCHLYMLFSVMNLLESVGGKGSIRRGYNNNNNNPEANETEWIRSAYAIAMTGAAKTMANNRHVLWVRGVPDESVVLLPCRIAYILLENATGVIARKAACGDLALQMIAATVDSTDTVLSTVTAALMDLMHSFDHMAALAAELCCLVSESPTNKLAVELIREMGRLESCNSMDGKASGVKNAALFIGELAARRPRLMMNNLPHVLPTLGFGTIQSTVGSCVGDISYSRISNQRDPGWP